ncbi:MAG: CarD family transcriptional regulator, partial [Gaiella sp.]
MDQLAHATPLGTLVDELRRSDRFAAFVRGFPIRARVSEPALPLLLAALHAELARALLVLVPGDADAREIAESVAWFRGTGAVAYLPSRGVAAGSGLEPPPHLVGERFRALDVLDAGGLVCVSAPALAEGMPPAAARPAPVPLVAGAEPGLDGLAQALTAAGYERVDRVDERGQFAVRGGLVDVFPTTGREPLRVELFGDEIEQIRAFSPFTQRALHAVGETTVYPATEHRAAEPGAGAGAEPWLDDDDDDHGPRRPAPRVALVDRPPDVVWQPDDVARAWEEDGLAPVALAGAAELDPFPRGQAHQFEAQRPALAARGLSEAENELVGFVRSGNRVVVAFAHRGEAGRQGALLRKLSPLALEHGDALGSEAGLRFAVEPVRRGFVWRELGLVLLPDTQVFRKRPPRADARMGRALASFADLRVGDHVVHEDHGVGKLLGFDTKDVAGVTRDYLHLAFKGEDRLYVPHEQLGKLSRYVGADARAPALSKLGGKAWQTLKARARASVHELAGELLQLYAQRQRAGGTAYDV